MISEQAAAEQAKAEEALTSARQALDDAGRALERSRTQARFFRSEGVRNHFAADVAAAMRGRS